ncbi:hypothetical protein DFH08DRAFT_1047466 [Mycena albidolilacea]|uniref:Epoxide hydrolase N-terminal domain-containing protein n=1 Tax=Mycena albidolilacea TaxID=1033008 RepID=A0AAD7EWX8_9AGAR|nr:hypothetical protein DFH08DRAFT_1047466 [Mycena albidolilacea]
MRMLLEYWVSAIHPTPHRNFVATSLGTPLAKSTQPTAAGSLVEKAYLPSERLYPGAGEDFGVQLEDVDTQRALAESTATAVQPFRTDVTKTNRLAQHTTAIGKQTVHFVHEKSDDEDAIPLLLHRLY